jgi:lactate dehydrogenase-like 2-hydroxyacid dehydrogenase
LESEGMHEFEILSLGLLRLGFVGKEMARIGGFFGTKVYYYDIVYLAPEQERELNVAFVNFKELLKISDILSHHLPINRTTKKPIGHSVMKSSR